MGDRADETGTGSLAGVAELLARCTFPPPGSPLPCAFSGGPDSSALLVLALAAGCSPVAHHVDHGLRAGSSEEAGGAAAIAGQLDVEFVLHEVQLEPGPNLEARAREARRSELPDDVATGHTLDDQAETVLINLLRGAGPGGLSAMAPSHTKPLLAVRRSETLALCRASGLAVVVDPSNFDPAFLRNRIRHELLPLCDEIAGRDVAPLLARTANRCRADDTLLESLAGEVDPTDAKKLAVLPDAIATRALRAWLRRDGYPPPLAAIERVLAVARGERLACELPGGDRVERSGQRLRRVTPPAQ